MTEIELDVVYYTDFAVTDINGNIVTGLVNGDFTKYLYNPSESEVWSSQGISISELGNGIYRIGFTPNATGDWTLIVVHSTYFPAGVAGSFRCSELLQNQDDIETKLDTIDTVVDGIKSSTDNLPADPTSETNAISNKDDIIDEINLPIVKPEIIGIPLIFDINNLVGLPTGASIELRLYNLNGDQITSGQITSGGNYIVYRFRDGGISLIDSGSNSIQNGYVSFVLNFTRNDWKHGDLLYFGFNGVEITVGSRVIDVESMYQSSFMYDKFSDIAKRGLVTTGSTTTEIHTDLTESDDFYNNMQVVLFSSSAGVVVRNIDDYAQTNGAITVKELPFTPAEDDEILILSRTGSVPIDTGAVADSVWDEAVSGHNNAGSFGSKNQNLVPSETIADYKADVSALATESNATTNKNDIITEIDANETKIDTIDANVDEILVDTDEIQGKLPTNYIMGSSDQTDKDDEIDDIKAKTDNLPIDPASETNVDENETKIDALPSASEIDIELSSTHGSGSWESGEMSEVELHSGLDSYTNKDDYKADVSSLATQTSVDDIQEDIGDPSSDSIYPSLQAKLNVLIDDLNVGSGSIKVYGIVKSNLDGTPQNNIRVRLYTQTDRMPVCEDFSNADGYWAVYVDSGNYYFEFAGQSDNVDGFVKQTQLVSVQASPSEQDYGEISLEPTTIDQGSGSETVGWNGSSWTYGLSAITVLNNPEEGVRVRVWLETDPKDTDHLLAEDYTDKDGRYTLYLDPEIYILKLYKVGLPDKSLTVTVT